MTRREFIRVIGGAAATWPLAVFAQQPTPVIGILNSESYETWRKEMAAFHHGLAEGGMRRGASKAAHSFRRQRVCAAARAEPRASGNRHGRPDGASRRPSKRVGYP